MNGRNSIRKVPQTGGVTQGARLLAVQIILFAAVVCLVGQPALAKHKGHKKGPKNCTMMSNYAFAARQNEIRDDYFIAVGKCYNLPPEEDIKDCIKDAREEQKDAKEEARDQREARLDLCEQIGEGDYNPLLDPDPDNFFEPASINAENANPYWPLVPGYKWTYKSRDENGEDPEEVLETNTVEVLAGKTVTIEGIPCVVVHDRVYEGDIDKIDPADLDAALKEDTYDWYAQQSVAAPAYPGGPVYGIGTVWYMGEFSLAKEECDEETGELCEGLWADDGSWQAGFDGGRPGVIMFGDPAAVEDDTVYRQELYLGEAEDAAQKIHISNDSDDPVSVPYGDFTTDVLENFEFSVLEPGVGENKYYAPGVGLLLEQAKEDGEPTGEVNELVSTGALSPALP